VADLTTCKTCNGVGNQIFTLTTTMRSVGGFDPSMPAWQDFELWVRIISRVGPMRRVGSCSYVQDLGHGLARISDDHGARIRAAYDAMAGKHRALYSRRELALLYLNYLTYEQVSLSLGDVMYGLRSGVGLQYAGALYSKAKARARLRFATRSA
jgi:hypothetical protein